MDKPTQKEFVKMGDILTKKQMDELKRCLKIISGKSKEEQTDFKEKLINEIGKLRPTGDKQ